MSVKTVHKEYETIFRKRCWWNSPKADVQFSVLRLHCPENNSKAKAMENCRYTIMPIWKRLRPCFAKLFLQNQLSLYGAVANMCEEYESVLGQNFSWIKKVCDGFEQQRHKFLKNSSKKMRYNWMRKILHADQRQKTKPQRREPAGSSSRAVPIGKRTWIDIEPRKHSLSEYEVSKKVIHLLRHSQKVHREEDGEVHFWRIKEKSSESIPTIYSLV